jgi:Flp pilus assembly protein TadG
MMRKLDKRGVAALEFCLVALPLFMLMLAIFDLGRYAITMHSLRRLADVGARDWMICYQNNVILSLQGQPTVACPSDPLPANSTKQAIAPFLYLGGLTPTLSTTQAASLTTVTASQPNFKMIVPLWGTSLNAPSASTKIPF